MHILCPTRWFVKKLLLLLALTLCMSAFGQHNQMPMSIDQRISNVLHNPKYVAVVAHRGDWRNWPENSIPAIKSAINMGVDMVEIDVKMTRDSVLVLCHDWTLDRTTTGSGAIGDYTYEQLLAYDLKRGHGIAIPGLKIPTLRQALELCKDRVLVNVDQGFDYYDQVLALTEELGMTRQVIIKSGWSSEKVTAVLKRHETNMIYMPVVGISEGTDLSSFNEYFTLKPPAFELCFGTLNEKVRSLARKVVASGAKVWVNTLWGSLCGNYDDDRAFTSPNPDAVYGPILNMGANIIQTDRPEFLIKYLEKKGRR
ncbi:MAG: glycerophosphodiester phosphodiesterase family protein [Bacteroidales bacterium]|nr:glycerophosphodiester phosphodiesterase family protein [Bacteroidales bacterium]